jgi:hypothetical protein
VFPAHDLIRAYHVQICVAPSLLLSLHEKVLGGLQTLLKRGLVVGVNFYTQPLVKVLL